MPCCVAAECHSRNERRIKLFSFPSEEKRRLMWASNVSGENWKPYLQGFLFYTGERYARPITNSFVTRDFSANEKRCIQCLQISCAHNIAYLNRGIICYN